MKNQQKREISLRVIAIASLVLLIILLLTSGCAEANVEDIPPESWRPSHLDRVWISTDFIRVIDTKTGVVCYTTANLETLRCFSFEELNYHQ